jgi:hypothetical protein
VAVNETVEDGVLVVVTTNWWVPGLVRKLAGSAATMLVSLKVPTLRDCPPRETVGALVPKLVPKIKSCCCAVSMSTVVMVAVR